MPGTLDPDRHFLFFEYAPFGDLDSYLKTYRRSTQDCLDISRQVLAALTFLHEGSMFYRDLSPQNIFVFRRTPDIFVKLGDLEQITWCPADHPCMGTCPTLLSSPDVFCWLTVKTQTCSNSLGMTCTKWRAYCRSWPIGRILGCNGFPGRKRRPVEHQLTFEAAFQGRMTRRAKQAIDAC